MARWWRDRSTCARARPNDDEGFIVGLADKLSVGIMRSTTKSSTAGGDDFIFVHPCEVAEGSQIYTSIRRVGVRRSSTPFY